MRVVTAILIESLKFQLLPNGNIKGSLHVENLIEELRALATNGNGVIHFEAEKRRTPKDDYTHMGPMVQCSSQLKQSVLNNSPTTSTSPHSLNGHTLPDDYLEKW